MFSKSAFVGLSLLSLSSAHFLLDFPPARGFDEDILVNFPCGGQNTVLTNRTTVSTAGFPVALTMGHDEASVEVLLALGNDPGSSFNIVLQQTFREEGLGAFCLSDVSLPSSLNITDGQNATLQVITNGDPDGGLYNCADITFSTSTTITTSSQCTNGTGVKAVAFTGASALRNANVSTAEGEAQSGSSSSSSSASGSSTASSTASTASASSSASSAANEVAVRTATWGLLGAAVIGALAAL